MLQSHISAPPATRLHLRQLSKPHPFSSHLTAAAEPTRNDQIPWSTRVSEMEEDDLHDQRRYSQNSRKTGKMMARCTRPSDPSGSQSEPTGARKRDFAEFKGIQQSSPQLNGTERNSRMELNGSQRTTGAQPVWFGAVLLCFVFWIFSRLAHTMNNPGCCYPSLSSSAKCRTSLDPLTISYAPV